MNGTDWEGRCGCEVPERPLSYGAYVCSKAGCYISVQATERMYPGLKLVIKFGYGPRQVISAQDFLVAVDPVEFDAEQRIRNVLQFSPNADLPDEYIREIFVMEGTGAPC